MPPGLTVSFTSPENNIILHGADALVVHRSKDARVVILEYDVHGKTIRTGAPYDSRASRLLSSKADKPGAVRR